MDSSSSLKRKRDHSSWSCSQDNFKRSSSLDRRLHQPLKHVKSELHGHGCVDRSVSNLSRLDKARSFARKEAEARSGTKSGSFTSTSTEKRSDSGNREKGFTEIRGDNSQGSSYAPGKLGHLKQNADEKQEAAYAKQEDGSFTSTNTEKRSDTGNCERGFMDRGDNSQGSSYALRKLGHLKQNTGKKQEGSKSGENLKKAPLYLNDTTASGSNTSRALGHGMDYADRSLSKGTVLPHGDRTLEQSRMSSEKDRFKRIVKLKAKHLSGSDASKDSNLSRARVKEEKHLACSPSKSNNGSPEEISSKSSSSARALRAQNSSSEPMFSERVVADTPLLFLRVTRRARSERRRDDSCKSHSSKGASLDGFCAELEEVLLTKQEAEVTSEKQLVAEIEKRMVDVVASIPLSNSSGDVFTSAALSGIQKGASLEEEDEREEGELEPEDEVTEKPFSGGGNEVKNVEGFDMHVEKISQDCNDLVKNKGREELFGRRQLLSESSRHNITLPAESFERHEEKTSQDCNDLVNKKGREEPFGCRQLLSDLSRHNITLPAENFERHEEKRSQYCNDLVNNKGIEEPFGCRQLLSESSRHNIPLPAEKFERHEEKRRQDSDGVEKQKACNEASGSSLLHSEPSRHCIAVEGSRDALEAVKSQSVPISDFVISEEEEKNGIDRLCERFFDSCKNDNTDIPAMDLISLRSSHCNMMSNAQVTDTRSHGEGDGFLKRGHPLSIKPAAQRQRTHESGELYGLVNKSPTISEKHLRYSHTETEGGDNRDSILQVHELDELSVHGHKQKRLKAESLQLSLGLPGCPSGSSKSLPKASENEASRTQVLRRAQSLSHLRTEPLSNGFSTSLSISSFVHNPSCSLNFISLEDQELSCGGSKKTFQVRGAKSDAEGLGYIKKSLSSLSNTRRERKSISPVSHEGLQDVKLLGSGIGLLSDTIGAIGYGSNQSPRTNYHCAPVHGTVTMQDRVQLLRNDAPSFLLKSNSERSKVLEVKSVADVKVGLLEIASEPIAAMAQKLQELPDGFLEGLKSLVKELLGSFAKREEFLALQQIIRTRTDLSEETLLRAHPAQLEILVSLKTGMQSFVQQGAKSLTYKALIEIFLQTRCRNVDCQQLLPVDGCECKVCSEKKGFCHECMCMVCSKFDSDSNTCRWVGCDVCMHWCHTDCGIRMSHIASTLLSRNGIELTEMQYQCLSCDHHMELYGFVKGVFENFARTWEAELLAKELDCVRRIFHGSEDARGKQLCWKAEELLQMLERSYSAQDVCSSILRFFSEDCSQSSPVAPKTVQSCGVTNHMEGANKAFATMGSLVARKLSNFVEDNEELEGREKERAENVKKKDGKTDGSQDLHSIIGAKLTDVLMYQARADAAREDAINLQRIISVKTQKMEEDDSLKSAKLRLDAAVEQRRKRVEELQALESSQRDYEIMKLRIQTDMKYLMMKIMERSRPQLA